MGAVVIRKVWQSNLESEFDLIKGCLKNFLFTSIDTEFECSIFNYDIPKHRFSSLSAVEHYALMKANVDALNMTQLGLTLFDADGNLPSLGHPSSRYVWEFNFRDLDDKKRRGINSGHFASYFFKSGLGRPGRAWVTFHALYDLGYLIKILTMAALPEDLDDFMMLVRCIMGKQLYDLKPMAKSLARCTGGLDAVAKKLGVERAAGKSHQAASDSPLTMQLIKILTMAALPEDLDDFMMLVRCIMGKQLYDLKPMAKSLALYGGLDAVAKKLGVERAAGKSHQAASDSLLTMQVFVLLVMSVWCERRTMLVTHNYVLYSLTC